MTALVNTENIVLNETTQAQGNITAESLICGLQNSQTQKNKKQGFIQERMGNKGHTVQGFGYETPMWEARKM